MDTVEKLLIDLIGSGTQFMFNYIRQESTDNSCTSFCSDIDKICEAITPDKIKGQSIKAAYVKIWINIYKSICHEAEKSSCPKLARVHTAAAKFHDLSIKNNL